MSIDAIKFRSREETFFDSISAAIPQLIDEFAGLDVLAVAYEPLTLQLVGVTYTPDFLLWMCGTKCTVASRVMSCIASR